MTGAIRVLKAPHYNFIIDMLEELKQIKKANKAIK